MSSPENHLSDKEKFDQLVVQGRLADPDVSEDLPYETYIHGWIDDIRLSVYKRFAQYQEPPSNTVGNLYYAYNFEDDKYAENLYERGIEYSGEPERRVLIRSFSSKLNTGSLYPDLEITLNDRYPMRGGSAKTLAILSKNILISGRMDEIIYSESGEVFDEYHRALEPEKTTFAADKTNSGFERSTVHRIERIVGGQPITISNKLWIEPKTKEDRLFKELIDKSKATRDPSYELGVVEQILEETASMMPDFVSSENLI